jgi:hypothetical protein
MAIAFDAYEQALHVSCDWLISVHPLAGAVLYERR